jgi:hypothetical protein
MSSDRKRIQAARTRCRELADSQYGVIARSQALEFGLTPRAIDRLLHNREWERVAPRVYRIAGAQKHFRQQLMVLSLWADEGGAVSHRSAGWLWGLSGVDPGFLEVTVVGGRPPSTGVILHRAPPLEECDRAVVDGITTTTPARTICDLAAVLTSDVLEIALDDALRRRLVSLPRLKWQLGRMSCRGRKGIGTLRELIDQRAPDFRPNTPLETRIGRVLLKSDRELPVTQFEVVDRGRLLARFDYAWPEFKVGIECESYQFHSSREAWRRDTTRLNDVVALGWVALRATDEDARDPSSLLRRLSRLVPKRRKKPNL